MESIIVTIKLINPIQNKILPNVWSYRFLPMYIKITLTTKTMSGPPSKK